MFSWLNRAKNKADENQIRFQVDFISPSLKKMEFSSYEPSLFQIIKTFVHEGSYVLPDEPLFLIRNFEDFHLISMPFGGYVKKVSTTGNHLNLNDNFLDFEIIEDKEHLQSCHFEYYKQKLIQTEFILQNDEFTDEKSISFSKVSGEETPFLKFYPTDSNGLDWFGFTFENNNGYEYILFHLESELMSLSKGDQIIFLFENKTKLVFDIEKSGKQANVSFNITKEIINALIENDIDKIKVIDNGKGVFQIFIPEIQFNDLIPILYNNNKQYYLKQEANFLLDLMLDEYIQINRRAKYLK